MTSLTHNLGLSPALAFHDVYSLDDADLLSLVPRPCLALLLVFPTSATFAAHRTQEDAPLPTYAGSGEGEEVVWFRQTIGNACGLYGLLHAVCNGAAREQIGTSLFLFHLQPTSPPPRIAGDVKPKSPHKQTNTP